MIGVNNSVLMYQEDMSVAVLMVIAFRMIL